MGKLVILLVIDQRPRDVHSIHNGFGLLCIYCLEVELHGGLQHCSLCSLFSFSNVKLHSLSISTAVCFLGLLFPAVCYTDTSSLVSFLLTKGSVPYIESFYCSQNLSCSVFLVPAGNSGQTWVHVHTSNTEWIQQIMFIYLFTYMCNNNN